MSNCCQLKNFVKFTTTCESFTGNIESNKIKHKSAYKIRKSLAAFSSGKKSSASGSNHGSNQKPRRERAISGVDSQCQLSTDGDFSETCSPIEEQPKEALSSDKF